MLNSFYRLLILLLITGAASCTIHKRQYRDGYYFDFHHAHDRVQHARSMEDTLKMESDTGKRDVTEEPVVVSDEQIEESQEAELSVKQTYVAPHTEPPAAVTAEKKDPPPTHTEQPGAEKDKPNRTVLIMISAAILLVGLVFLISAPYLAPWIYAMAFFGPLASVLLYISALIVRRKYVRLNMAGSTDQRYRLSKWYHKFKLPLHLFFGAILMGCLGFLMAYSGGFALGGLSFVGVMIVAAAGTFAYVTLFILTVLGILYLFKWRRSGEQKVNPDEKKRKDG